MTTILNNNHLEPVRGKILADDCIKVVSNGFCRIIAGMIIESTFNSVY